MTFRLVIDLPRWQAHLDRYLADHPWVVPVVKGDGYGIGAQRVLEQCARVRAPLVAVGTVAEAREALLVVPGEVMVLFPVISAADHGELTDPRVVRTVAGEEILRAVADDAGPWGEQRYVVEVDSPMGRHGIEWPRLPELRTALENPRCQGLTLHNPPFGDRVGFVESLLRRLRDASITVPRIYASHLTSDEVGRLSSLAGSTEILVRTGTDLWLGDLAALQAYGTVIDVHPVHKGQPIGYSQRKTRADGYLAVVSGGTAHGVGIETARPRMTPRLAARRAARTVASAVGAAPSPFRLDGRRLSYADVPHMQVSMVHVPSADAVRPGDELPCDIRITVTRFDEVDVRS